MTGVSGMPSESAGVRVVGSHTGALAVSGERIDGDTGVVVGRPLQPMTSERPRPIENLDIENLDIEHSYGAWR
jgi:hypothetical protein